MHSSMNAVKDGRNFVLCIIVVVLVVVALCGRAGPRGSLAQGRRGSRAAWGLLTRAAGARWVMFRASAAWGCLSRCSFWRVGAGSTQYLNANGQLCCQVIEEEALPALQFCAAGGLPVLPG